MKHRLLPLLAAVLLLAPAAARSRIPEGMIRIGVLQDAPDSHVGGTGGSSVVAAQLAASDFETEYIRGDAEILPGVSNGSVQSDLGQVRDWLDKDHVAAVLSTAGPIVDRQIARMVAKQHRTLLVVATGAYITADLCAPDVVVWGAGPNARARALAQALVPRVGKRWYVMADQSPLGIAGQAALHDAVSAAGGQIVGETDHAIGEADLRKAAPKINQADPQVIALAESGADIIRALRSAGLAGLSHKTTIAAPYARIGDVDDTGPAAAEGLTVVTPFYWDTNGHARRFARRWDERVGAVHAGGTTAEVYTAAISFLRAAKAVEDVDAGKVLAELRRKPLKGTLLGTVTIRPSGRAVYDLGVYRVKSPDDIHQRWAYYAKLATIPGTEAFPAGACGRK